MNIKLKRLHKDAIAPKRISDGAVGFDLFALRIISGVSVVKELPVTLKPGEIKIVGIGFQMVVPFPYEIQIRPRAGLAARNIRVVNSPGTIDPDYRGEVGVILVNDSKEDFVIEPEMRIAQAVFVKVEIPVLEEVAELPDTRRSAGGFGHTGLYGEGLGTDDYEARVKVRDHYYMGIVLATAEKSRCVRGVKRIGGEYERNAEGKLVGQTRKLGCVIVGKENNIIAHGFNAQYPGSSKCDEVGCLREETGIPSGEQIEKCRAMHAEWWAITNALRSGSGSVKEADIFLNAEPCEICAKIITGLGIETMILLAGVYPANGTQIIRDAGINVRYVEM